MATPIIPQGATALWDDVNTQPQSVSPIIPDGAVPIGAGQENAAPVAQVPNTSSSNPSFLPNYNAVMDKIGNRPSMIADLIKDPSTLARFQQHPLGTTLRTIGGAMQYAEGVPAAVGLAAQSGKYGQLPDMLGKLAQGKASPQLGDLIRTTGFGGAANEPLASTIGFLATLGATPAAKVAQPASDALAYNVMKDYLKPTAKDFSYAHDPVRGMLNEGLVFNNVQDAAQQATLRTGEIGQQIKTAIQNSSAAGVTSDISSVLNPIDEKIAELSKSPASNATAIQRLMATKLDLANSYSPQGNLLGPKDFNMTPAQAFDLKQQVSQITKWTGNMADDKPVNSALQQVYSNIRDHLNTKVSDLKDLNQRYGDMTEATKRLTAYMQNNHIVGNTLELGKEGAISALAGHVFGPAAGYTLQGLQMAAQTGAVKSRLSKLLYMK